ncbi:glucoamylase family protein [Pontibacter ruber]|uniref:Glucoamylase family protein n=1 Tax=Pontibacter ruber TaxID=1343895 RepID=A0ABW5CSI7_9BACT|nr:glucoamylase family protein [Pontibacter ruber]
MRGSILFILSLDFTNGMQYIWLCFFVLLFLSCNEKKEEPVKKPVDPVQPPVSTVSDKELLDKVQEATFRYFWDFAHPVSGMARERSSSGDVVTSGGTGFGVQAIVVGVSRGWITRQEAVERLNKLCDFLSKAERFHGAWPHWLNGSTGAVIPFSAKDNGGDLVETSYLINGLLTARAYFNGADARETELRDKITQLWETVEWSWYASRGDGLLYWHWSRSFGWEMNMPIRGWNEALITYILALGSPTHPITPEVYQRTWVNRNEGTYEGYRLSMGPGYGGPLFFAHYSFLSLDPKQMEDQYTHYWMHNLKHTLINRAWSIYSATKSYGYSTGNWGLTASDDPEGYKAHQPTNDNGTIAPTAALSSFPYTPYYSMQALRHFESMGAQLWGTYGFKDAFNKSRNWVAKDYLAIDQGPIVAMIENYRSGLLWSLFTDLPEVQAGLAKAGIRKPVYDTGFPLAIPDVRTSTVDLLKHPDKGAYQVEVAVKNADPFVLTLEKPDGSIAETIWNNETKTNGLHQVNFGASLQPGAYKLRLKGGTIDKELSVYLH